MVPSLKRTNWPYQRFPKAERALLLGSLLYFVALLPFQVETPPLTLGLMVFGATWLFGGRAWNEWRTWLPDRKWWPFALYYLYMAISLGWSEADGSREMTLKLSMFFWPLAFAVAPIHAGRWIPVLLKVFLWSLAGSALLLLAAAAMRYNGDGDVDHFFYDKLIKPSEVPLHYLSMYYSFGMGISAWHALVKKGWEKLVFVALALLFGSMVVLLAVRIQFFAFPLVAIFILLAYFRRKGMWGKGFAYSLITLVAFVGLIAVTPDSKQRVIETVDEYFSFLGKSDTKQTNPRVYIWQYAVEVVEENWLLGTGTGAADVALGKKLEDCDAVFWMGETPYKLADFPYNYHNVFLQNWASYGILGMLFMLYLFLAPLKRADALAGLFLLLCAVSFSTESMLERQAGVLFFAFFYGALLIWPFSKYQEQRPQ